MSEFGIRLALGAQKRAILWLALRGGFQVSLLGTVVGIVGGIAMLRVFNSVCPGMVDPKSASVFGIPVLAWGAVLVSAFVLMSVALFACWLPARRATKIDPMTVLRCD